MSDVVNNVAPTSAAAALAALGIDPSTVSIPVNAPVETVAETAAVETAVEPVAPVGDAVIAAAIDADAAVVDAVAAEASQVALGVVQPVQDKVAPVSTVVAPAYTAGAAKLFTAAFLPALTRTPPPAKKSAYDISDIEAPFVAGDQTEFSAKLFEFVSGDEKKFVRAVQSAVTGANKKHKEANEVNYYETRRHEVDGKFIGVAVYRTDARPEPVAAA